MERLNCYPRGYLVRLPGSIADGANGGIDVQQVESDPIIESLYKVYMGQMVNSDSWEYRKRVIAQCSKLFGNFRSRLLLQLVSNDYIYGLNLEFLRDTVQYIRTGRRSMSVFNWQELLLEHPDNHSGTAGPQRVAEFGLGNIKEFDNFIGEWCSKEGGFEDMLCTAHVLFGVSKKPMVSQTL